MFYISFHNISYNQNSTFNPTQSDNKLVIYNFQLDVPENCCSFCFWPEFPFSIELNGKHPKIRLDL